MTKVYDATEIREKLVSNDKWLVRGILAIYERQTADEKSSQTTKHTNGVGFNGRDAAILSSFAKQILSWQATSNPRFRQPLSSKQFELARRMMSKYAAQLARIAEENNSVEDEVQPSDSGIDVAAWGEMRAEADFEREAIMAVERGDYDDGVSW